MKKEKLMSICCLFIAGMAMSQGNQTVFTTPGLKVNTTSGGVIIGSIPGVAPWKPGLRYAGDSVRNMVYSASFDFLGVDINGQIRAASSFSAPNMDLFPGAFSTQGDYSNPSSMWEVTRAEIDYHMWHYTDAGYQIPDDILNWPGNGDVSIGQAAQLAPYKDLNQNGVYEPLIGEYPDVRGDKVLYMICNDDQDHMQLGTEKMGIEVHYMLYYFGSESFLKDQLFIRTQIFNRGTIAYNKFGMSFYGDFDIGNATDDFCGSDSARSMIYAYNGDYFDENYGSSEGFGTNVPVAGMKVLNVSATGAVTFYNGTNYPYHDPVTAAQYYNYMMGLWQDGSTRYYGGLGHVGSPNVTNIPTNFMYGGTILDTTSWTEKNNNNPTGDRRMMMTLPFTSFYPDDRLCYDFVLITDRSAPDYLQNVQNMLYISDSIQVFYDTQYFECGRSFAGVNPNEKSLDYKMYPNPTNGWVNFEVEDSMQIRIFNINGALLIKENLVSGINKIQLDVPSGIYFVEASTGTGKKTTKLVVQ